MLFGDELEKEEVKIFFIKIVVMLLFLLLLFLISWTDWKWMKIPDRFVTALFVIGLLSVPFFTEISLAERAIGAVCISVPFFLFNLIMPGALGGGDMKLMAAGGFFLGWRSVLSAFLIALFMAGGYAIWLLMKKKADGKSCFAFGPFLCFGMASAFLYEYLYIHMS